MVARARAVEEARKNKEGESERGWDGEAWMLDDHHRQRKKGGGKRVAKRARKKVSKTTRGAVLGRMYGRAIIYWRVGTSEGSGVRAGRVVLHSRGC